MVRLLDRRGGHPDRGRHGGRTLREDPGVPGARDRPAQAGADPPQRRPDEGGPGESHLFCVRPSLRTAKVSLVVAPDREGRARGTLYLDDGKSYDYRAGGRLYMEFTWDNGVLSCKQLVKPGNLSMVMKMPF